jgi:hypothetical protein
MKKLLLSLITASTLLFSMNSFSMQWTNGVRVGAHMSDPAFIGIRYDEMSTEVERSRSGLIVNLLNSKLGDINRVLSDSNSPYKIVEFRIEDSGYLDWKTIVSYSVSTINNPTVDYDMDTNKYTSLKVGDPYYNASSTNGGIYFVAPDGSGVIQTGVAKAQVCDSPAAPPSVKKRYCK